MISLLSLMALIVLVLLACYMQPGTARNGYNDARFLPRLWHPIRSFVALFAFGMLMACATTSVQSSIASLEVGLTTAESAATAYARLPACGGMVMVCSNPALVAKIKAADNTAFSTIKAAEATAASGGTPSLVAANAALAALQGLIPALGARP